MDDPLSPIIIVILSLLLAAVVRLAEAALPFIDEGEAQRQADAGDAKAKRALRLIRRSERSEFGEFRMTHAALLLCAVLAAWCWLGAGLTAKLSDTRFPRLLAALCVLVPGMLIGFTVTGVLPEHLAAHYRQPLFDRVAAICEWTLAVFSPVTRLALALGALVLKPFHIKPADAGDHVTEEDIMQMVDIGEEKGAIEADEREMIENIFEFNNTSAEDCMVHR